MPVSIHPNPKFKFFLPGTNQLAVGAKLFTYIPGTSTKKTTYLDFNKSASNTNPIILDANAEATLWLDGKYKLVLAPFNDTDPPASPYWTLDNVGDVDVSATTAGVNNKIKNGSMEVDTDGDGVPDSWTVSASVGDSITIEEAVDAPHGKNSLVFSINSGLPGTATTDFFEASELVKDIYSLSIMGNSFSASLNVTLKCYDLNKVFIGNVSIVSLSGFGIPSSWADSSYSATALAGTAYAKIEIEVIDFGGQVRIDNVRSEENNILTRSFTRSGSWTITGQTVIASLTSFSGTPNVSGSFNFSSTPTIGGNFNFNSQTIGGNFNFSSQSIGGTPTITGNWLFNKASPLITFRSTDTSPVTLQLQTSSSGSTGTDGGALQFGGTGVVLWNYEASDIVFGTNNISRMGINSSGAVVVGSATAQGSGTLSAFGGLWGAANQRNNKVVILDTPETFINTSTATGAWTTFDSTTLSTAGATAAILSVETDFSILTPSSTDTLRFSEIYIRKTGSGLGLIVGTLKARAYNRNTISGDGCAAADSSLAIVNLNTNFDFDYYTTATSDLGVNKIFNIALIGYLIDC